MKICKVQNSYNSTSFSKNTFGGLKDTNKIPNSVVHFHSKEARKMSPENYQALFAPLSFGSTCIYTDLQLKDMRRNGAPLSAHFAKLDPKEDAGLLQEVSELWEDDPCNNMINNLNEGIETYAVITNETDKSKAERVLSLVSIIGNENDNSVEIYRLISKPQVAYSTKRRPIKGSGALAVYGVLNLAREGGYSQVEFDSVDSESNKFYNNLSLKPYKQKGTSTYEIPKENFSEIMQFIEDKYEMEKVLSCKDSAYAFK